MSELMRLRRWLKGVRGIQITEFPEIVSGERAGHHLFKGCERGPYDATVGGIKSDHNSLDSRRCPAA